MRDDARALAPPIPAPDRFVPRYAMVSFRRIPYATALARGTIQRELLVDATRGIARIEDVDMAALDRAIATRLPPLAGSD